MKTLFEHAEFELERAGIKEQINTDPTSQKVYTDTLALIRRFEKQKHGDESGRWVLEFFESLCHFLPLAPVSDNPDEWEEIEETRSNVKTGKEEKVKFWQCNRAPAFISYDGGKTFTNYSTGEQGKSVSWEQWKKEADERSAKMKAESKKEKSAQTKKAEKPKSQKTNVTLKVDDVVSTAKANVTKTDKKSKK